jgi:hypothetical protein
MEACNINNSSELNKLGGFKVAKVAVRLWLHKTLHWKIEGLIMIHYGITYICEGPYKATA